jgi:hypothetical protein
VDIGSNVGWITFSAARMGARVAAFEGEQSSRSAVAAQTCTSINLCWVLMLLSQEQL